MKPDGKKVIYAVIIMAVLAVFFIIYKKPAAGKRSALINGNEIEIEVADTPAKRYLGLSNRDYLCSECGMLFIFADKEAREFVMREMEFNLDIIWISDGRIVKIDKDLPAEGEKYEKIYSSGTKVDMVLELNAGYCDGHGIKVGDIVELEG
ncbi:hypothetical protein A2Y83_00970 [Candidatus Falkowbacteria bacterium RBG_13_39_14]|uniref:DUF192 domain-containing protein n=1 Tax=Candidatus Falkowbacteria bacterium RBG_13_39_14 TaxID=1797985 RepID=A0A1F5S652_9BACT|nr:MAG: hypothetical protein A2Y83_00970 [Candidatus Falkowbacteria bacterium RBG_13_39_14]